MKQVDDPDEYYMKLLFLKMACHNQYCLSREPIQGEFTSWARFLMTHTDMKLLGQQI